MLREAPEAIQPVRATRIIIPRLRHLGGRCPGQVPLGKLPFWSAFRRLYLSTDLAGGMVLGVHVDVPVASLELLCLFGG